MQDKDLKKDLKHLPNQQADKQKELDAKAVEGAKKALREYGKVFERLAEYDRT